MTYIAELQIKVDSSQVESATQKLKEFTQATTSSTAAEQKVSKARTDSSKAVEAAEQKAAKAEQTRLDQWFAGASKRDKEEQQMLSRRRAIMDADVQATAASIAAKQKAQAQADKDEQKRLNDWLKQGDARNKEELKQAKATADAKAQYSQQLQARITAAAKATSDAEIKAAKDALKEQQSVDRLRLTGTLRRIEEERKAEEAALSAKASAEEKSRKQLAQVQSEFDPGSTEIKRLNKSQATLDANKGNMSADEYTRINNNIETARKKALQYNDALGRTSLSAKQLRMAQMGLPAQFTDIVVSLQGGQAPMTVLLQQGGQIKDMFGGLGPAFKGVSSALMGLVNPFTVAAAAAGLLLVAYNQGSSETDAYRVALVSTGNAAGTTTANMAAMAKQVDGVVGTTGSAAAVMAQLAASGKVTASSFVGLTVAAEKWEKATGTAATDTVKQFAALGDEPLTAAKRLNEQTNFLTASLYQQAAALVKQGDEVGAATLLQEAYADSLTKRADEIVEKQGYIEKAWNGIKGAAKDAWDAMLDVGRPNTLADDLDAITNKAKGQNPKFHFMDDGGQFNANVPKSVTDDAQSEWTARLQREVDEMTKARQEMFKGEDVKKAVKEFDEFQKSLVDNASKADKLSKALEGVDKKAAFMRKNGLTISDADIAKAKDQLKDKYKETGGKKTADLDTTDVNDLANKVTQIKAQYATLTEGVKAAQENGTLSVEQAVAKRESLIREEADKTKAVYEEQIAALEKLKGADKLSASQKVSLNNKIADVRSKMVVAEEEAQKKLTAADTAEKERLRVKKANVDAYNESLQRMIDNLRVAGERERAGLGQTSGEKALSGSLNSEDDRYADEVRSLNKQKAEKPERSDEIDQDLANAADAHTKMKNQIVSNYNDMKTAQQDWGAGIKSAYKQYVEDGQNYASLTNSAFTSAFSSMEDALTTFVTTGQISFKSLTTTILGEMAKIAVRIAASAALQSIFGAVASIGTSSASSLGSTQAGYSATYFKQAKGGAWDSGTQFFAKGGAFTNSVVSTPTAFSMSGGSQGVMGEAGPEAIMPLTRASDGSLGVRASVDTSGMQQTGATGGVQVNIQIDGQGNSTSSSSDSGYDTFGKQVGDFVNQRYKELIAKDLQPGGDIWKSQNGG